MLLTAGPRRASASSRSLCVHVTPWSATPLRAGTKAQWAVQPLLRERMGAPCDTGRTKCELLRDFPQMVRWKGIDEMDEVRALDEGRRSIRVYWTRCLTTCLSSLGCGVEITARQREAERWLMPCRPVSAAPTYPVRLQVWWSTDFFEWDLMR